MIINMKYLSLFSAFFLAFFLCLNITGCDLFQYTQEKVITQTRAVSNFTTVHHQTFGDVEVKIADAFALKVEGDSTILTKLKTQVKDGALNLFFEEKVGTLHKLKFFIEMPRVDALKLSGLGTISASGINTGALKLELNGTGQMEALNVKAQSVESVINGSGSIEVTGTSMFSTTTVSGLGHYTATDLETQSSKAEISGAGFIKVFAVNKLEAIIDGDGLIEYKGTPQLTQTITGRGVIRRL